MKQAQIIGLSVALVAGGLAFVGMRFAVRPAPAPMLTQEVIDAIQVLVARNEISLGQVAAESNFRWQDWPKDSVSPSFITKNSRPNALRDFSGSIARTSVAVGEPITDSKLVRAGAGGVLAAILPAGSRAISTKISQFTAAGKLILPNDRVDVILIQRKRSRAGGEEITSDTMFRNVRVLAIGQTIEAKDGKKNADGDVATLEMTPRQAELLALANSMGEISLSLRSVADYNSAQGPMSEEDMDKAKDRGNSIRILRYGVKTRSYGIN